jgi:hypothetical protein
MGVNGCIKELGKKKCEQVDEPKPETDSDGLSK